MRLSPFLLEFFDLFQDVPSASGSVNASLATGQTKPWLEVTGTLFDTRRIPAIARFHPLPLLTAALLVAIFCAATAWAYRRRQVMQ